MGDLNEDDDTPVATLYKIVAVFTFLLVTAVFLFPLNKFIPIDRRTVAILGTSIVYLTHAFLFPDQNLSLIDAVDFQVIVLLASIMVVNFLLIRTPEVKEFVNSLQAKINTTPRKGFWYVGLTAFCMSPLITNDGFVLLCVSPILVAFEGCDSAKALGAPREDLSLNNIQLTKEDSVFFMLNVACAANIGSALTYIGNPQNMIVSTDSIEVLPPYMFLGHMLIPSILSFVITTLYLERCWLSARKNIKIAVEPAESEEVAVAAKGVAGVNVEATEAEEAIEFLSPMSPARRAKESGVVPSPLRSHYDDYWVRGPFPYGIVIGVGLMIVCIFAEVLSIAGIVCSFAVLLTVVTVFCNYWRGSQTVIDQEDGPQQKQLTHDQRVENLSFFFEELFASIDMNILLIFIGLFVVIENLNTTGMPKQMWSAIVGDQAFRTVGSVLGISMFVLVASQFVGNVPIIQLALPNCQQLNDTDKRYAWAILSFVATVGGNLTLTGSAANVIVAEQVSRLIKDKDGQLDFWVHYRSCFWVTLLSCFLGGLIITASIQTDENLSNF